MKGNMPADGSDRSQDDPAEEEGLTEEELEVVRASYERNRKAMERLADL